jgi:sugar O-acyltransferase (sialic acid O-acetyltransferase NeuD family)
MSKPIVIFGTGPSSRYSLDIARALMQDVLGFLDDNNSVGTEVDDQKIIGNFNFFNESSNIDKFSFLVPIGDQRLRAKIGDEILSRGGELATLIHPSCEISHNVRVGLGCVINAFSYLHANCQIENHVIVENHVSVGIDSLLGVGVQVSPGCSLNWAARLGSFCTIGSGVTVNPQVKIGSGSSIGAGATVVSDIAGGKLAVGVPAKVIKDIV